MSDDPFTYGPARVFIAAEGEEWREIGELIDIRVSISARSFVRACDEFAGAMRMLVPPVTGWRARLCWLRGHQPDLLLDWQADLWTCRCRAACETGERRERLREA